MGFTIEIGEAQIPEDDGYQPDGVVETIVDESVHVDEMEGYPGESVRTISYSEFGDVREAIPAFNTAVERIKEYSIKNDPAWIPVSEIADLLDEMEEQAEVRGGIDDQYGRRVIWFVNWCREIQSRYGEKAGITRPGEF